MKFDAFLPGATLGVQRLPVAPLLAQWRDVFPAAPDVTQTLAPALLVAAMMRGYILILKDRPPGNVHAGQVLRWGAPASTRHDLEVQLSCLDKVLKAERRWVTFGVQVTGEREAVHLSGEMRFLWAA